MTLYNYGQNGNTVAVQHAEVQPLPPVCVRYADMADGADYVVVLGGANDKRLSVPLGETDSTSPETFCGALNVLIAGLTEKYPRAMGMPCDNPFLKVNFTLKNPFVHQNSRLFI